MRAKPIPETPTQRQRDIHELTHLPPVPWCPACVSGSAADDPRRRRQDARDSGLDVASFDHCDISAEVGMFNKKLKFKVLVSHRSGAVAALEGPKDVTEHMVRFVCDMLETSGSVCVLKCQNEPPEMALHNAVVRTRQFKTISRNTPRYSHGSLGHCESAIKEVEKQIRATLFQMYAENNCNSEKFPAELQIFPGSFDMLRGHSHGMRSKLMVKRHFFNLMSKGYHGEVGKVSELVWCRIPAKQPKLAEQWREANWGGKSERSDERLLAIRGSTHSARAIRRKPRDEQWNLESVKAVLVSPWELHESNVGPPWSNENFCTRCSLGTGSHSSSC